LRFYVKLVKRERIRKPLADTWAIRAFAFALHICDDTIGFQSIPGFCSVACQVFFLPTCGRERS
jgi:hypothetical protein